MAKDSTDTATLDFVDASKHGGRRAGAGRKKGATRPKKQPAWRVTDEAIEAIKKAAEDTGHKAGDILDWAMKNHKKIPKNLD